MSRIQPQKPAHLLNAADSDDEYNGNSPMLPTQGPQIPPHLANKPKSTSPPRAAHPQPPTAPFQPNAEDAEEDEDAYLPALPPDLVAPKRKLGPTLPANSSQTRFYDDDLSDSEEVGPMPAPAGPHANAADDAVREFMEREERRRKADEEARQPKKLQREEWMLVPPSSSSVLGCTCCAPRHTPCPI